MSLFQLHQLHKHQSSSGPALSKNLNAFDRFIALQCIYVYKHTFLLCCILERGFVMSPLNAH
jgi:hypothetical protein